MKRPEQRIFIVENNTRYAFDAVIKTDLQTSLKVAEEEGDVKKGDPVNFAITQPDKIEMEVSVSNTVTVNGEPLTRGSGERAILAYKCLRAMQIRRNLLTVITPFDTFTNMMIETLTCELAEDYQEEMHAQIAFKQMTVKKKNSGGGKKDNDKKPEETGQDNSAAWTFVTNIFGNNSSSGSSSGSSSSTSGSQPAKTTTDTKFRFANPKKD